LSDQLVGVEVLVVAEDVLDQQATPLCAAWPRLCRYSSNRACGVRATERVERIVFGHGWLSGLKKAALFHAQF